MDEKEDNLLHIISLDKKKKDICEQLDYKIYYYTKKYIVSDDFKINKKYQNIYNDDNVFFNTEDLFKKIIEE